MERFTLKKLSDVKGKGKLSSARVEPVSSSPACFQTPVILEDRGFIQGFLPLDRLRAMANEPCLLAT
jgi:hypothetical protein